MQTDWRLFGIDLIPVWRDIRSAWQVMGRWPIGGWLSPQPAVRVVLPAGDVQLWRAGRPMPAVPPRELNKARYSAALLPEDILLRRQINLPPTLSAVQAEQALALDIQAGSPFPPEQLLPAHAWRADAAALRVSVALTSRQLVGEHLHKLGLRPEQTEVWIPMEPGHVLLPGFGESRRQQHVRLGRWAAMALALGGLAWLVGMALTPTLQLRQRAIQAVQDYDRLAALAEPAGRQRAALLQAQDRVREVQAIQSGGVPVMAALDALTQALPDETFLHSLRLQGTGVSLAGQTPNAAELMKQLGGVAGIGDVRAPTPATRRPGATKESFGIELVLQVPAQAPEGQRP